MEMTREEAIKIMENEVRCVKNPNCERLECRNCYLVMPEHTVLKAYEVAIKALEQEPCADVVSRQWLMECVNEGWIKFDTEKDENRFIHLVRDIAPPVNPQPCGDLISRKTILEEFENDQYHLEFCKEHHIERSISMEMVRIRLHDLPLVNPQLKMGRWVENDRGIPICSCCGKYKYEDIDGSIYDDVWFPNYCPNCGAKMIEPKERSCEG